MSKLVIFGAGDIARLACFYFTNDSDWDVVGFTVDRDYRTADTFLDFPLVDFHEVTKQFPPDEHTIFVALSYNNMNQAREEKYREAKAKGYRLANYVSSHCTFLSNLPLGDNCFILEDNTIQPFVKIGNNVTLWSGNHIGHDSVIGDHCFISSHVVVSGHVRIASHCFIGVNATLRNGITVAPKTLIGAGAVIMNDTVEGGVYVPERAKRIDRTSDQVKL